MRYNTVLSIAGSDPSGGAGIQADIKTCTALGCYAMTAITAVTVQCTTGVQGYRAMPPQLIADQIRCVCTDIRPDAVKIGMVPDVEAARAIADALIALDIRNIVVDPVMVATAGQSLSNESVQQVLIGKLEPQGIILTPNLIEADALAKMDGFDSMFGAKWLLVKGGHGNGNALVDTLYCADTGATRVFPHPKIDTPNTHGTGCSLSSAIASYMAKGCGPEQAVASAIAWLQKAIAAGAPYSIGHGHGPVNHMFDIINIQK